MTLLHSFADAIDLPDASCHAITSTQTLKYIEDVDASLAEAEGRFGFTSVPLLIDACLCYPYVSNVNSGSCAMLAFSASPQALEII